MKSIATQLFYFLMPLLLAANFSSCKKSDSGGTEDNSDDEPSANVIKGTIKDAHGNPLHIAGATVEISIWGIGANGDDAVYTAHMDDHGHYGIKVSQGAYQMRARLYVPLNGNRVCIDLAPLDGVPDNEMQQSKPGIVRNYGLMLTGLLPGANPNSLTGHAGAHITFTDGARSFTSEGYWNGLSSKYPGGRINFVLTPKSSLIDGSEGSVIELSCTVEDVASYYSFWDFPLAAYELSATLTTADNQELPLGVSVLPSLSPASSATLLYEPDKDDHDGRPVTPNVALWAN